MSRPDNPDSLVVFQTALGWMALIGSDDVLKRLTFAHKSARAAIEAIEDHLRQSAARGTWNEPLVERLEAYAEGIPVDFRDVKIDPGPQTRFQRGVTNRCRRVPYGETISYGQLAAAAGSPQAARAVGNCMAANRFPLIVPCHRVIPASGRLGAFSAPGGPQTKQRLLTLEAENKSYTYK